VLQTLSEPLFLRNPNLIFATSSAVTLQKQADNPVRTAIPILKVNSVADFSKKVKSMGGKEVLPQMICPCTNAYFAIWTDAFGNQILIKEPKGTAAAH